MRKDINKEILHQKYIVEGKGTFIIAKELGFKNSQNVAYYLEKFGIPIRRERQSSRKDLKEQRFGDLLVIDYAYYLNRRTYWLCRCNCGEEVVIASRDLVRKDSKSRKTCGCRGYRGIIPGMFWSSFFKMVKKRVGDRECFNLFDIDYDYMCDLFLKQNSRCALSGLLIQFGKTKKEQYKETTASVDRIDSTKGYIKGNVQWVHKDINWMKGDIEENKFVELCGYIWNNKKSHKAT